jgi:beta-galactosidase/beta-glucuronidase
MNVPRPEYPRPQLVRQDWMNLNGEWEFVFDDADLGQMRGWHDGREFDKRILVPFPYQSELSGINDKGIHQVVWYARSFEVPEEWQELDLLLHFGAVDYRATVWVNGKLVGNNRGGHVPFAFDIAPYLKKGENRLTVRVEDTQDPHQPRGKQAISGIPGEIDYYCTTGIWQTVWLEPLPPFRLDEIKITPLLDESAFALQVILHAPSSAWRIEAELIDNGTVVSRAEKKTFSATARFTVNVPEPKLWSPDSPHLYDLRVRLYKGDELLDEVVSYAGLRSIELHDKQFYLNNEPIYLAMVLDQGYWRESLLAAPSDEALKADVELTKQMGFNGARKHQKIEDPRWLYWCDKLGLLVWGEMANARAWSSEAEEMLLAEWERAVRRDYNHPCIITWVPVNESMGFPELRESHPGQYSFLERIVRFTRRLDTDRPVIDNDGWEHTDITDVCAIHDYTQTSEGLRERYKETLEGGELPKFVWLPEKPLFMGGSSYQDQPVMLTEVGGFLLIPPEIPAEQRDILYKYYGTFQTSEELLAKYRDLISGIGELHFVSGFCYTQLTDIEQEINGLLTYDRQPKVAPEEIARVNQGLLQTWQKGKISTREV